MMNRMNTVGRRRRAMGWVMLLMGLAVVALPLTGYTGLFGEVSVAAEEEWSNPRANLWREVRQGTEGYTSIQGGERGVLINGSGENWRTLRNGAVAPLGGWLLGLAVVGLGTFFLFRGTIRLEHPRTGEKIQRWSSTDRLIHWYTASVFLLLAITGLSVLFGRAVLIPLLGKEGFATWAGLARPVHDYLGPLFLAGILLMAISWLRANLFNRRDWEWFRKGGGIVGKQHPSAGRFNGGEKLWFWLVLLGGLTVSASGLILDFPNFGQGRGIMQWSSLIHASAAIILVSASLGHIYIGTVGTEGAFEGMKSGYVDASWAMQHHDVWYEEVKTQQEPVPAEVVPRRIEESPDPA